MFRGWRHKNENQNREPEQKPAAHESPWPGVNHDGFSRVRIRKPGPGATSEGNGRDEVLPGGREADSIQIRDLDDNDGTYHRSLVRQEGGVFSVRSRMYHGGDALGDYPVNALSAGFDSGTLAPLSVRARVTQNSHLGETRYYTLSPVKAE